MATRRFLLLTTLSLIACDNAPAGSDDPCGAPDSEACRASLVDACEELDERGACEDHPPVAVGDGTEHRCAWGRRLRYDSGCTASEDTEVCYAGTFPGECAMAPPAARVQADGATLVLIPGECVIPFDLASCEAADAPAACACE